MHLRLFHGNALSFIGGHGVFQQVNSSPNSNILLSSVSRKSSSCHLLFCRGFFTRSKKIKTVDFDDHGQRAVATALRCNFLVLSLKLGVWLATSSHVMLAEALHSVADIANQVLLAYGLNSSKRAPDSTHPCFACSGNTICEKRRCCRRNESERVYLAWS